MVVAVVTLNDICMEHIHYVSPKQFRHIQETIRKKYCAKVGKKLQKSFKSRQGLEDNSNNASVFLIDDVQFWFFYKLFILHALPYTIVLLAIYFASPSPQCIDV